MSNYERIIAKLAAARNYLVQTKILNEREKKLVDERINNLVDVFGLQDVDQLQGYINDAILHFNEFGLGGNEVPEEVLP